MFYQLKDRIRRARFAAECNGVLKAPPLLLDPASPLVVLSQLQHKDGNLTVTTSGITNAIPWSGTGVAPGPIVNANPSSLSFPATIVGSSAATQSVTVTNSGTTTATVSGVTASGDFSQTNTCSTLAVGASCTVTVGFTPTVAGARTGTVTLPLKVTSAPRSGDDCRHAIRSLVGHGGSQ